MQIFLSVCVDNNGGISKNGDLPWDIKEDMGFFMDQINKPNTNNTNNTNTNNTNKSNTNKSNTNNTNTNNTNKPNTNKKLLVCGKNTFQKVSNIKDVEFLIISTTYQSDKDIIEVLSDINLLKNYLYTYYINYDVFILGGKNIYEYAFKNFNNINFSVSVIKKNYYCDNVIDKFNMYYELYIDDLPSKTFNVRDHKNNIDVNITFYSYLFYNSLDVSEESSYLNLLEYVLKNGEYRQTRNALTYSVFGKTLEFNLDKFPLLTTKKMFFKGIVEELMFFIRGETDTTKLSEKGVKIWEGNTTREFLDKMGFTERKVGDIGPMYGYQWRNFFGFDQLKYCINLLKTDPTSRRIIMTSYNPAQAFDGVLFPCHGICIMFYCTHVDNNNYKLDIMMTQRSCDLFLGVPFNIASYSLFAYLLCDYINKSDSIYKYIPGRLIMNLGDAHIYEEHKTQAIRQILRNPLQFPTLDIKTNNIMDIEKYEMDNIILNNYTCYPAINAKMVA
jgi:thymidylate synthase